MGEIETGNLDQTTIIDGGSCIPADSHHPHLIIFSGNIQGRYIRETGAKMGLSWEVYGHWNDDSTQLVTDVYYMLENR